MSSPNVQIVIVNRNSGPLVGRCVESMRSLDHTGYTLIDVTIIDDGSTDRSGDRIVFGDLPGRIIRRSRQGYGASCNAGALESSADYVVFMNTDLFLQPDTLSKSVAFLDDHSNSNVGILGIQLRNADGTVARHCRKFPTLFTFLRDAFGLDRVLHKFGKGRFLDMDYSATQPVDQVLGAFMLMRGDLFRGLGGYDERFFVYCEDLDLSLRVNRAGYSSVYFAETWATHLANATARRVWAESIFFNLRSKLLYISKWFGLGWGIACAPLLYTVEPLLRSVSSGVQGRARKAAAEFVAMIALWLNLPFLIFRGTRANWPYE